MRINSSKILIWLLIGLLAVPACKTSKTVKGAVIGGAVGGVAGGAIGKKSGNAVPGIIIGAAIGGTAGAFIGRYMDKQAEEIRKDLKGATVERVGEGILITFDSGLLFDVDSYSLRGATRDNLTDLARVLNKYEDTEVLVAGHTDSTGSDYHNQKLSENRASAVKGFLAGKGVLPSRMTTVGYGEGEPVADNNTDRGRQQNRRVEVAIYANKKLQRAAKKGELDK